MLHKYKYKLLLIMLFSGATLFSYGQSGPRVLQRTDNVNGKPAFVKFEKGSSAQLRLGNAETLLRSQLQLRQGVDALTLKKESRDGVGFTNQEYRQSFRGIPVEDGVYKIHAQGGDVVSMNGQYIDISKNLSVTPQISEKVALQKALAYVGAKQYMWQKSNEAAIARSFTDGKQSTFYPQGKLVIVQNRMAKERSENMKPVLAYKFDVYASEPVSRDYIYVDARTGKVVQKNSIIKHFKAGNASNAVGTAETRYSGTRNINTDSYSGSYRLRDNTRGNGVETYNMNTGTNYNSAVDFTDNDNNWTSAEYHNSAMDDAALDAHWGAEMTYDFWSTKFNRNSYDNNGSAIKSYVHYDKNYENAYWNGSVMTYGDGATRFDALTALDVCAHEIGHAVCENTANLNYQDESGAMNEGFSDIWGASVEYFAAPNKSTWLIGEDIDKQQPALRSMSDPKSQGQPDTYQGTNWYTGTSDNGGVHTNSGVLNHWYYVLSVGESGTNDIGTSYNVSGITIDKAEKIAFRTESVYLTSSSTYADARTYSIQAATDLYGAGSNEVIQTTNAWNAVGVGGKYGQISYCASKGNNSSYEHIASVTVGSFTNTSGAAGYSDFTGQTISLTAGNSYSISLEPGFSSSTYNEYFKIWIDYNNNGDFTDAGELAYDAGSLSKTTVTGTINVPSGVSGTVRMRVSMKYNGAQTACETFSYGEVEDYTVDITSGGGTTACDTPTGLSVSSIGQTSATLSWGAVTGASNGYNVRYRQTGTSSWTTTSTSNTSLNVTGLTAGTQYEFQVQTKCASNNSSYSSSTTFTTQSGSVPVSYCTSQGNSVNYEWIDLVQLGSINNSTGANGGYGDFTSMSTNLAPGSSQTMYVSAGFASAKYTEYWEVWIDFNHDGDFNDAGEEIVTGSSSSANKLSDSFTVPAGATLGETRMRVSMKYGAAATPCESFSYGEVEDYTVNISNAFSGGTLAADPSAKVLGNEKAIDAYTVYPNPASATVNVRVRNIDVNTPIAIFNMQGAKVKTIAAAEGEVHIDVSNLEKGIYLLKAKTQREVVTHKLVIK